MWTQLTVVVQGQTQSYRHTDPKTKALVMVSLLEDALQRFLREPQKTNSISADRAGKPGRVSVESRRKGPKQIRHT